MLRSSSLQVLFSIPLIVMVATASGASSKAKYKGIPYRDSHHQNAPQKIPGRVECAYYDRGGEGVAYHDSDAKNNGSGALNPADGSYLNEFRMNEGVDISYTKFHDQIDNSPYDLVQPAEGQLYVGWTEPGEWFKITVDVAQSGLYSADLLYTSNRGGTISIDANGKNATGPIEIQSTFNSSDPIAWRQWHHWNVASGLVKLRLPAGKSVLNGPHSQRGQYEPRVFRLQKNSITPPAMSRPPRCHPNVVVSPIAPSIRIG